MRFQEWQTPLHWVGKRKHETFVASLCLKKNAFLVACKCIGCRDIVRRVLGLAAGCDGGGREGRARAGDGKCIIE